MTPWLFSLFVPGVPQPAGSKKAIPVFNRATGQYARTANGRPIVNVVDDAKHSRSWKDRITALAVEAWKGGPLFEPLELSVVFTMPRPKGHFGKRGGLPYLRADAPRYHSTRPDATKLLRAAEDALLGVVYVDDAYVVEQHVRKIYGDRPGVAIRVRRPSVTAPQSERVAVFPLSLQE